MSIRPPNALAPKRAFSSRSLEHDDPLTAALEHEVLAEKAATYGRLLARLEQALQALRAFEGAQPDGPPAPDPMNAGDGDTGNRDAGDGDAGSIPAMRAATGRSRHDDRAVHDSLLADAGEALWHVVIQRDLCGLRNHEMFHREYDIPARVRLRMGLRPRTRR